MLERPAARAAGPMTHPCTPQRWRRNLTQARSQQFRHALRAGTRERPTPTRQHARGPDLAAAHQHPVWSHASVPDTPQHQGCTFLVQWSEDVIKADPFFGRSRVRFRVPPWVSNTIARDHLA